MKSNKNEEKKLDKKKKIIIGIILFLFICCGIIAVVLLLNKKEEPKQEEKANKELLLKEDLEFEINSELTLMSLVSEDNKVKVLSEDENIDTSTLGEKEITIKYEIEENESEKTVTITIVDTKAPTIEFEKELSTNVGTKIDLLKNVKVSDNSKEEIKASVEGEYDFNKEGTYNLKYVAVDSSNNKKEEDFILKVNKKSTNTTTNKNTTKPQTNNKNNSNSNSNNSQNDTTFDDKEYEEAKAIYDKYVSIYKNKYTTKQESFSPEPNVTIKTVNNPMKWHYEWIVDSKTWQLVDDTTGWVYGEKKALAEKIYPPPNRDGKELTYEENGITYYTGEKTEVYQVYLYTVIYDSDCCKFF